MKQKYLIARDDEKNELIIREYAELDKEVLSPLCEENYPEARIQAAISRGKENLIAALRTKNMYPPGIYADKIADSVIKIYRSGTTQSIELLFDDIELLAKSEAPADELAEIDEDSEEIDELLDEDYDEEFEGKNSLKNINSPLKIADDDVGDPDNDS